MRPHGTLVWSQGLWQVIILRDKSVVVALYAIRLSPTVVPHRPAGLVLSKQHIVRSRRNQAPGLRFVYAKLCSGLLRNWSEAKTAIVQDASGTERRVQFQFLSFNIGSTTYPPASFHLKVLSTRPIQSAYAVSPLLSLRVGLTGAAALYDRLQVVDAQLKEKAQENSQQTLNVCIVGGGVAGVEMALCLFQRWNRCSGLAGRVVSRRSSPAHRN